ncbi:hypothetical protein SK128_017586 [Halocaridina rubra]|uniref:Uncharacterized protein n=1 Tax=Halocaridina rubra TaxID=373956 RepID=A0AAN9A555_HALRR
MVQCNIYYYYPLAIDCMIDLVIAIMYDVSLRDLQGVNISLSSKLLSHYTHLDVNNVMNHRECDYVITYLICQTLLFVSGYVFVNPPLVVFSHVLAFQLWEATIPFLTTCVPFCTNNKS